MVSSCRSEKQEYPKDVESLSTYLARAAVVVSALVAVLRERRERRHRDQRAE